MTPEAVEALRGVAVAVDGARTEIAGLTSRWADDMETARVREDLRFKEIRARENRRFKTVNRTLALIVIITALAVLLLGVVVYQTNQRAEVATNQRRCSDIVNTDVLGRLSILAVQPRFRTAPDGTTPVLDEAGRPILLTQQELLSQTEQLRRDVDHANHTLTRIADICYGPDPDPTPLDGDPTK